MAGVHTPEILNAKTPESYRKVASWASLFQDRDNSMLAGNSEIGQYSCTRLLREMEMVESDFDEEIEGLSTYDLELVRLPEAVC
jgi:hypothetical protein